MISYLYGLPGAGKGAVSMAKIIECLRTESCPIVTNLPVKLQPWVRREVTRAGVKYVPQIGLISYLLQQFGKTFDVEKRLLILDDDQAKEFFRYRGPNREPLPAKRDVKGKLVEYETSGAFASGPVFYLIDEAWKFWNSRNWQETGFAVQFYVAQHRHFGDTVWIVSQHPKQVETIIRQVVQDYHEVTNFGNRMLSLFRMPDKVVVNVYPEMPTSTTPCMQPGKPFSLDKKGVCQCYDTSAGVGLGGGGGADGNTKKKGLPFWVLIVLVLLVIAALSQVPRVIGYFTSSALAKVTGASVPSAHVVTNAPPKDQTFAAPAAAAQISKEITPSSPDLYCRGYSRVGPDIWAFMSDGRKFSYLRRDFVAIVDGDFLVLPDGRRIWVKQESAPPRSLDSAPIHEVNPKVPSVGTTPLTIEQLSYRTF